MEEHASKWRYSFNTAKCAVMVVGERTPPRCARKWFLQGEPVAETREYKYLGFILEASGRWNAMQSRRTAVSKAALPMLFHAGARHGALSMVTGELLVEMLLWSRMAYGSEISTPGVTAARKAEMVQSMAARQLLGVNRSTSLEMLRGELGWLPLSARRSLAQLRYLGRLQRAPPGLLRDVFLSRMASASDRIARQQVNTARSAARSERRAVALLCSTTPDVDAALATAEAAGRLNQRRPPASPRVRGWCAGVLATLGCGSHQCGPVAGVVRLRHGPRRNLSLHLGLLPPLVHANCWQALCSYPDTQEEHW